MRRRLRGMAAMLLTVCMVFSAFYGIPVRAEGEDDENNTITGLWVTDSIECNDDGTPLNVREDAEYGKETWTDLYGTTLYFGYTEENGDVTEPITDNFSVLYDKEDGTEPAGDRVSFEVKGDFVDFTFNEVGEYIVQYGNEGGNDCSVTIHVRYPEVGFYTTNEASSDALLRDGITYKSGTKETYYMILHRYAWSKLDLDSITYWVNGETVGADSDYFTIKPVTSEEASALAEEETAEDNPSDYLDDQYYVYEMTTNPYMVESFWLDVEIQKQNVEEVQADDEEETDQEGITHEYEFVEVDSARNSIEVRPAMQGLIIYDWIEWDGDGIPSACPDAEPYKETWTDLYGNVLYFGYAQEEGAKPETVTADKLTVLYNGEEAGEDKVTWKANEENGDLVDFTFYEPGDYTVSCKDEGKADSFIIIHVYYPALGFYEEDEKAADKLIRELYYERGTEKTFYIKCDADRVQDISYHLETEDTRVDGDYITVNGKKYNPEQSVSGDATVTITADAKCSFGLKAVGTVTYAGEERAQEFEQYLWCVDDFQAPLIEDGLEHSGFAGCFITEEAYKNNGFWDELSENAQYWVHADTLQQVIDKLMDTAAKGSVTVDEKEYDIVNDGYIWVNASYLPKYSTNGTAPQYVTTPSDVKGIIIQSGFEMYYTVEKDEQGSYYEVQQWKRENDAVEYTCLKEDGKYYPVTGSVEEEFHAASEGGKTEEAMLDEGYTKQEDFGIDCQWSELHVDATTNVKILGDFAEAAENKANVYLGLYEDSNITSYIMDGEKEDGMPILTEITSEDIGEEITTTDKGIKVKVVGMAASMASTVEGSSVQFSDVTLDVGENQTLRDKLNMEEIIAGDEALKKALLEGTPLDVSLDIKGIEGEPQDAEVKKGVDGISAFIKEIKDAVTSKIQYLDMGLNYKAGDSKGSITETKEGIKITMALSQDFAKPEKAATCKIVVYRYHDGKAERLESTYENGKLTFITDRFSVYAIAVEEAPTGGDTAAPTQTPAPTDTTPTPDVTSTPADTTKAGDSAAVEGNNYKVTSVEDGKKTVTYTSGTKNASKAVVPATVTINGAEYKVTAIANGAFSGNKKLTAVTIGKNVTTIGDKAFSQCTSLKKVTIPAKVSKIGKQAFAGCKKLATVTLGKNVTTIGDKAFSQCTALKKITLPTKVNKIGKEAFAGCKNLKSIDIKTSKLTGKNVGSKAFKGIASKAVIKVPKKKLASYKKLLKEKGAGSKVKIKK